MRVVVGSYRCMPIKAIICSVNGWNVLKEKLTYLHPSPCPLFSGLR